VVEGKEGMKGICRSDVVYQGAHQHHTSPPSQQQQHEATFTPGARAPKSALPSLIIIIHPARIILVRPMEESGFLCLIYSRF
jgi:hypothetical protein